MKRWPKYPTIYEINTWVWLSDLSTKYGNPIDLSSVPAADWDAMAGYGYDGVWLMGVWERSPAGIEIANRNENLLNDFRRALPDFRDQNNVGSPYCVRRYVVDEHLGGPNGLAIARQELAQRKAKLVLDFVPNHVAPDHPWVTEHPEYFVRGNTEDACRDPASWAAIAGNVYARGRDRYFPAWPAVLQLNAFQPSLQQAVIQTLLSIEGQCDAIRCDMAMLLLNAIFERTWGAHVGQAPATEYWANVISAVKKKHPGFLFIAEAYWGLEWELQQHGFDFCYDKKLYDRLEQDNAESIRLHLCADPVYQSKILRFIENHDEPPAAATLSATKERAAAVATNTVMGTRLFEGQFDCRKVELPVFLGRRHQDRVDEAMINSYEGLLEAIDCPVFRDGQWILCTCSGSPDNASFENLAAWSWLKDEYRYLIVINLSDSNAQGRIHVPWQDAAGEEWCLQDAISGVTYEQNGDETTGPGLYVELGPWNYSFFQLKEET